MDLGPHAAFIWVSYGLVALVLAVMIVWLIADGKLQQRRLQQLEARGIRRRSARSAGQGSETA